MDLDSVCRICLLGKTQVEGEILVSLSSIDEKNEVLSEKIMSCTDVQITDEDNLPMRICVTCIDNLDVAYRFKKQCEENDFTLRQCLVESVVVKDSIEDLEHTYNTKDCQVTSYVDDNWTFQNSPGDSKNLENTGDSCSDVSVRVVNAVASSEGLVIRKDDLDNAIGDLPGLQVLEKSNGLSKGTSTIQNYLKDRLQSIYNTNELSGDVDTNVINIELYEESSSEAESSSRVVVPPTLDRLRETGPGFVEKRLMKKFQHLKSQTCFVCKVCGKVFKSNTSLQGHERRHTGERPFMCQVCGKSFHVVNELKKHSLVHSGLKPYKCRHCSRSFSDWGSRFKHERCHSGERPYKCEECGKCFTYACVLAKHKLTHSGVKNFSCTICDKNFTLKFHLTNHNRKYHPVKAEQADSFTSYLEDDRQDFTLSLNEIKVEN